MAKAQLGDYIFDINPRSMNWSYKLTIKPEDTYGGRVIQLLSCKIDSVTLQGYLPVAKDERKVRDENGVEQTVQLIGSENQFAEMEKFEKKMLSMMEMQADTKKPIGFAFPALGYKGDVYITQYGSVEYSYDASAISYTLQLTVDNGYDGLKTTIMADAQNSLDSIPDGINWTYNKFNTPVSGSWERALKVIENILNDSGNYGTVSLVDYYQQMMEAEKEEKQRKKRQKKFSNIAKDALTSMSEAAVGITDMTVDSEKSTWELVQAASGGVLAALKGMYLTDTAAQTISNASKNG